MRNLEDHNHLASDCEAIERMMQAVADHKTRAHLLLCYGEEEEAGEEILMVRNAIEQCRRELATHDLIFARRES